VTHGMDRGILYFLISIAWLAMLGIILAVMLLA
jgi:hypothetical protein